MRALFDTSVLVAALVERHPEHEQSFAWLRKAKGRSLEGYVASHCVGELYRTLTSLPVRPRISTLCRRDA